jgi:hypothetical protein
MPDRDPYNLLKTEEDHTKTKGKDIGNKAHVQPQNWPKLLPLLHLKRERFNSFEGSFIISCVR